MRIAMVSEHASPLAELGGPDAGGQNVYVAQLSKELARRGHDVTVHTRRDSPDLPDRVPLVPGVTVEHVPAGPPRPVPKDDLLPHMPAFGAHLARRWAGPRPHVVHAHFWMSGLAALAGAHGSGVPVVQTFHALGTVKRRHQGADDTSPPERIEAERRIGLECDRILATCSDEVFELGAMGVPPERASVVPCGVDTEEFAPCPGGGSGRRDRHGASGHRPRLLAIGRLVPRKGFDQAVAALTRVPDAELLIAGGPDAALLDADPEAERLRRLARESGVADRVRLLGAVPHERMPELIRGADLVLSTPRYEPFGIVPLEAMACGVPVVATGVGGHLDSVADRVTGRLVPPGDPDALAHAVKELIGSPELLRRYGEAGRKRALARFSWERVADGAEQVYAQVVSGHRVPAGAAR
ncbi:glycosyltransferase [Streptomyces sp. TRM43335]|uniref:D-inositol 3-phosphate glycosyltransferase n=1 Tax=Streptomyces taklimakanensis TaxID=2569853 RepID=A0A6G2BIQ5_9ACTN|nr:glycosyltransferase [Streptomyces taklimakanensis]MTE21772.1 glycosyltransferase [Streptomyces taklimakanensis]